MCSSGRPRKSLILRSVEREIHLAEQQQLRLGQEMLAPFATLASLGVQDGAILDLVSDTSTLLAI